MGVDEKQAALQRAYNAICSALRDLDDGGMSTTQLRADLDAIRDELGHSAYPPHIGDHQGARDE